MSNPAVVLFSSHLLPPSQTFIRALGEELRHFVPYYVGCRYVKGLELPAGHTTVVNAGGLNGTIAEMVFKVTGMAPTVYQQVQQWHPALIHAQFGLSGALALPLSRSLKIPLIVHFRGADATTTTVGHARFASLNHWIYVQRREALKQEAQLFITVSNFIRDKLIEQGFPRDRIIVHYHGVNTTHFQADSNIDRERIVLFVGRLTEKKGCEYLIRAMTAIQERHPDVELVLIGDGPLRANLEQLAATQLRRHQFLGVQPATVVKQWMNRARILAAPSVTAAQGDSEGLPNVVLEAQSMGLPVVSTTHAGIPEAVIQGETGFLAPERDVAALAKYLQCLLEDQDLWQRMSGQGQEHMRSHFNRATQSSALETIYETIVREHS
jgi:colanic acid/amylovoran biosynthesis glycosyltransferase